EHVKSMPPDWGGINAREALVASGVAVVDAASVQSKHEALAVFRRFGGSVAIKADAPGLIHKSDLGCVRLNCGSETELTEAYEEIVENARKAGFGNVAVILQPMVSGIAEAYAGIIYDHLYGPAIAFGLGGIFVELLKDTTIEMAPMSQSD